MNQHDVSGWVSSIEAVHERLRVTASEGGDEGAQTSLRGAMSALAELYEQMLHAEVRATFAERAAGRGDG